MREEQINDKSLPEGWTSASYEKQGGAERVGEGEENSHGKSWIAVKCSFLKMNKVISGGDETPTLEVRPAFPPSFKWFY